MTRAGSPGRWPARAITAAARRTSCPTPRAPRAGTTRRLPPPCCAKWYTTKSYRPPPSDTARFKYDVAEPAYGEHDAQGELDHLIPLELGGNNDASNLWPEPGKLPNLKDSVEGKLHIWVCAAPSAAERQGRLEAAQQAIAADWVTALQVLGVGGT